MKKKEYQSPSATVPQQEEANLSVSAKLGRHVPREVTQELRAVRQKSLTYTSRFESVTRVSILFPPM